MSENLAPGWRLRCPKCGKTKPAEEAGIIRIGARSRGKRVLGWCSKCRWLRFIHLERVRERDVIEPPPE